MTYLVLSEETKVEGQTVFRSVVEFGSLQQAASYVLQHGLSNFRVAKMIDWNVVEKAAPSLS